MKPCHQSFLFWRFIARELAVTIHKALVVFTWLLLRS